MAGTSWHYPQYPSTNHPITIDKHAITKRKSTYSLQVANPKTPNTKHSFATPIDNPPRPQTRFKFSDTPTSKKSRFWLEAYSYSPYDGTYY